MAGWSTVWGAEAVAVGREIQANLGLEPMERPFLAATEELIAPEESERILRREVELPHGEGVRMFNLVKMPWHRHPPPYQVENGRVVARDGPGPDEGPEGGAEQDTDPVREPSRPG